MTFSQDMSSIEAGGDQNNCLYFAYIEHSFYACLAVILPAPLLHSPASPIGCLLNMQQLAWYVFTESEPLLLFMSLKLEVCIFLPIAQKVGSPLGSIDASYKPPGPTIGYFYSSLLPSLASLSEESFVFLFIFICQHHFSCIFQGLYLCSEVI